MINKTSIFATAILVTTLITTLSAPATAQVLITEADGNTPDFVEVQNVGNTGIDVTGWQVIISDDYTIINDANSLTWTLSGVWTPGQIDYRDDNSGSGVNYWGNNMFWLGTSNGWVMLVDDGGTVRDFVAWGWSAVDIAGMSVSAGGFTGLNPGSEWVGNAPPTPGSSSLQRVGDWDNNDATDWQTGTASKGTTNVNLTIPFGMSIVAPSSTTLPDATEGQTGYAITFEAANGTAPYEWTNPGGNLPGWLSFNTNIGDQVELQAATVSGTPGQYTFDIQVEDALGDTNSRTYRITVNAPPVVDGPTVLDPITATGTWSVSPLYTVMEGTAPYQWSITGAPAGMTVNVGGELNGPPASGTAGTYSAIVITVTDANGVSDSTPPMSLVVNPEPTFPDVVVAQVGEVFTREIPVDPGTGTPPLTYQIVSFLPLDIGISLSLPAGTGIPLMEGTARKTQEGDHVCTLKVTDASGVVVVEDVILRIPLSDISGDSGGCFVVTASGVTGGAIVENLTGRYGLDASGARDVAELRAFRDERLMASRLGRDAVRTYATAGPTLALASAEDPAAGALLRTTVVRPAVGAVAPSASGMLWWLLLLLPGIALIAPRRRG